MGLELLTQVTVGPLILGDDQQPCRASHAHLKERMLQAHDTVGMIATSQMLHASMNAACSSHARKIMLVSSMRLGHHRLNDSNLLLTLQLTRSLPLNHQCVAQQGNCALELAGGLSDRFYRVHPGPNEGRVSWWRAPQTHSKDLPDEQ